MERQYRIFVIAAAGTFAALIITGLFFSPVIKIGNISSIASSSNIKNSGVIQAQVGKPIDILYSPTVVGMIQRLPRTNNVTITTSSELHNIKFSDASGEMKYSNELIRYTQQGKVQTVTGNDFRTIEYKFLPDKGNQTKYTFENVQFPGSNNTISSNNNNKIIVSVIPLSTAKVGERYTVKLDLDTGGLINYAISEKTIEIVP